MESFLIYIGKSAIAAGAFYVVFLLLFQNRKQFVFNRIYLPVSLLLSFVIPLITFTTVKYIEPAPAPDFSSFAYLANTTEIQTPPAFVWEWYHYLFGIYLLGAAGFLFHLLLGHLKAISIIRKSHIQNLFKSLVNITKKDVHPFSFFNKIVLSEKTLSHPNLDIIVNHESIHVKEKHTFDILFAEILFLFQWFNPFAWLMKDAVKNNLEYKTDHEIAKSTNPQTYQMAMVTLADKRGVAPFLTALNGSQLKNRIIMMKKKTENKYALLKQLVVLPLLAVLIMGLSNKEVKTEIISTPSSKNTTLIVDGKVIPFTSERFNRLDLSKYIDEKEIVKSLGIDIDKVESSGFSNNDNTGETKLLIRTSDYIRGSNPEFDELTYLKEKKNSDQKNIQGKVSFKALDKTPTFPGGELALKKYIDNNIKYPEIAAENGISGKVYVSFVIDKNGKVTDAEISRGVDPSLDKEALRIVNTLPRFILAEKNGKKVDATYTVPVEFKLPSKSPYKNLDEIPTFPGGESALKKYIDNNIKYPEFAAENGIQGIVYVSFIIDKNGKVTDPEISRGVVPSLDKEALRVVNTLPRFKPGEKNGKKVDVNYTVPVVFKLTPEIQAEYKKLDLNGNWQNSDTKTKIRKNTNKRDPRINKVKGFNNDPNSLMNRWSTGNPLYIVDGKEMDSVEDLDPKLIESISVLKNESAVDLYGAKAKNGVIIICTKQPMKATSEQLYIVDGKEVSYDQMQKISVDQIASVDVLKGKTATNLYGEKAKNGVIVITTKGDDYKEPVYFLDGEKVDKQEAYNQMNNQQLIKDVIRLDAEQAKKKYGPAGENGVVEIYSKKNPSTVDKLFSTKSINENPLILVDGKRIVSNINQIDPVFIEKASILKGDAAREKYGELGKNGVIEVTLKKPKELTQNEIPVVLNGKPTGKKLDEIDSDLIEHIKKIDPEEATKKYGNFGKMGVLEVTSRKLYTDNVKVKSSDEITTPLELRKFIANKIKYPVEAQKNNITGTVKLWAVVEYDGKITHIYEKEPKGAIKNIDEVVVVGYSTPKPKKSGTNSESASHVQNAGNDNGTSSDLTSLLTNEVKRVLSAVPALDIPYLKGKTVEINVKFMLQ